MFMPSPPPGFIGMAIGLPSPVAAAAAKRL